MESGWDELPNVHALVSCMSKMNVIYNRIRKGFKACSCLSGSWWLDCGCKIREYIGFLHIADTLGQHCRIPGEALRLLWDETLTWIPVGS